MNYRQQNLAIDIKKRNLLLILLGVAGISNGFLDACFHTQKDIVTTIDLCFALISLAAIYLWIYYDAKVRRFKISKVVRYLIILLGIIGVPVYFWQTRNFPTFCLNLGGLWLFAFPSLAYYASFWITVFVFTKLGYYS